MRIVHRVLSPKVFLLLVSNLEMQFHIWYNTICGLKGNGIMQLRLDIMFISVFHYLR